MDESITREEAIIDIDEKFHLLDCFFESFVANAEKEGRDAKSVALKRFSEAHVTVRLQFLNFILRNSPITMSGVKLLALWRLIIVQIADVEVRDVGFQWFNDAFEPAYDDTNGKGTSSILAYVKANFINCAFCIGIPSSLKAMAPFFCINSISVKSSPFRPFETAPIGKISIGSFELLLTM